ncbi:hypothetical protein LCGC14_2058130 [marine sediment metagenome]|uniref:Uncharacterized protein n=1 Tax=marine sediment metagenome TaxID=412755 RepID=A0A0F9H0G1_9ZZZZ
MLDAMSQLKLYGMKAAYDEIITTADYSQEEKALIGVEPDNEKIVGRFKQRVCQELGVGTFGAGRTCKTLDNGRQY